MIFVGFLLIFSGLRALGAVLCPPLNSPRHGTVSCRLKNAAVSCSHSSSGVVATFRCEELYKLDGDVEVKCSAVGNWTSLPPACVLDCGRKSSVIGLIVNGIVVTPGEFPWHVAIYNFIDEKYEYWCGGSLISEHAVITAAHCVWQTSPNNLMIVFGKTYREFTRNENFLQKIKAKKVEIVSSYQDADGNYAGDIAVIFTEKPVTLSHVSSPVCFDWDQRLTDKQLSEGNSGAVVGWGLTENDTVSDHLRMSRLPVVSDQRCINKTDDDFKKFVTYTSFCAGFGNGTGVCNGDSGGGLVFFDGDSGRWYLQGIVSVSPRRKGTPFCDPHSYAVFTKAAVFSKWLQRIMKIYSNNEIGATIKKAVKYDKPKTAHQDLYSRIRKYFGQDLRDVNGKRTIFPHTKKMLEWASRPEYG